MTSDTANRAARVPAGRRTVAVGLVAVMALEIVARTTELLPFQAGAWAATLLVAVAARRQLGLRELYLLSVCAALAAALSLLAPNPARALAAALDQASFLMAFIVLLGLLHEAASTSPSVEACGRYLTRQPPGRRYYALYAGTAFMSVLFNIGVVSFLVPLVQRGLRTSTPGDPLNPVRERRQLGAVLRGFAWAVTWSPTAMAPLIVVELIPSADRQRWIALGLVIFLVIMVLGAVEDRLTFRRHRPSGGRLEAPFPNRAALMFLAACGWLLALTAVVVSLTGDTVVFGLMVACPVMLLGWLAVQAHGAGRGWEPMRARLLEIAWQGLPASAPVAVTLACSGFIGRAAATLVPGEAVAAALGLEAMPDFVLLSLLPVALTLLSLLALSPVMMAVFFGSLFGGLAEPPADPTLIALAISCGWALSMTASPFATVVLQMARVGGLPVTTLTWRWNRVFSLIAALALVPIFAALTGGR